MGSIDFVTEIQYRQAGAFYLGLEFHTDRQVVDIDGQVGFNWAKWSLHTGNGVLFEPGIRYKNSGRFKLTLETSTDKQVSFYLNLKNFTDGAMGFIGSQNPVQTGR